MHVEELAERIIFLKGEIEMKASNDVEKIHDVKKMLESSLNILFKEDRILFPADSIPLKNDILNYDNYWNLLGSLDSIQTTCKSKRAKYPHSLLIR